MIRRLRGENLNVYVNGHFQYLYLTYRDLGILSIFTCDDNAMVKHSTTRFRALSTLVDVEWCFTPLSTIFQSYHGDNSHYSCLSWVLPVLGWGFEVSCPMKLPQKARRIDCSSVPWITSQTLYHSATQDPFIRH